MKLVFLLLPVMMACGQTSTTSNDHKVVVAKDTLINEGGSTILKRVNSPSGYERPDLDPSSFEHFLRNLPLKPHGAKVMLYNGQIKENYDVYDAVVDLKIGKRDLHQCADAIMRLRADYLYQRKLYDQIHFNFTNGFRVDYTEWMKGKRIKVRGDQVSWVQRTGPSNTPSDLWNYLEMIFSYAGTLSLSKELKPVDIDQLRIGDIFILGGSPGHAIIVVDMTYNPDTGQKLFLLAQSYMPAQEIQLLKNPNNDEISPWYSTDFGEVLITPEWEFSKDQLMRFEEN